MKRRSNGSTVSLTLGKEPGHISLTGSRVILLYIGLLVKQGQGSRP